MEEQKILILALFLGGFTVVEASITVGTDPGYVQEVQASMAKIARSYIEHESKKLEQLKRHADDLDAQLSKKLSTVSPLSMYMQTKKLLKEWDGLYKTMNTTVLPDLLAKNVLTPKPEHLGNMADAIFRLQDVYQFDAIHIASGLIPQVLPNGTLSAKACRDLGLVAFEKNDHYHALVWFQAAVYRLMQEATPSMDVWNLYPLLALSLDKKNNTQRARQTAQLFKKTAQQGKVKEIVEKYPQFKKLLEVEVQQLGVHDLPDAVNERLDWYGKPELPKYEAMCRQEANNEVPQNASNLTCYYDRTSPYLLLAPAKVEALRTDPFIAVYRQVISDNEIKIIQGLAAQKMNPSTVGAELKVEPVTRESFTAWLKDEEHPVVARVRSRVAALTKLKLGFAEDLQVVKYGLGGHYRPHYDTESFRVRSGDGLKRMNCGPHVRPFRVATFMFYFAAPDHGGATIFPYADLAVTPSKNDAIFWYNLHRDGNSDAYTLHAGCPVISGSKWVANQWMTFVEQQVTRPCALTEDKRRISNNLCSCSGRMRK